MEEKGFIKRSRTITGMVRDLLMTDRIRSYLNRFILLRDGCHEIHRDREDVVPG